ncbi:carboxypeptidase M32 [Roseinatronobacter bogoriensis]|uniref:Metal-dependent carboxypeptidase n=1 Tax=Roseinatronobacter bogoriensis subsp. barguzinensis TaxID=441209 RepID=A0A2K8KBG4_9RHOB|nr:MULTISPECIES: carboxypeptidase M32 [Rhodobaca]ATX66781.1 carboxypeptidase M32 [Rhodobaca barguzinensis]MBB4206243.1 carboxypeptidase Taq [Rhodobaca bogoriensis DSM 18756]TDW40988.1 carboxypeptidase Taq [Rhodobaca barguzinensis]TDY74834.1 carboxypeptidase Taq [Rhodobaca bogoriensis DSM 18756]
MSAYQDLLAFARQTEALAQISGRLGWDQQTVMPRGANAQRSEEMAALEEVLHARRTDPRLGEWLDQAEAPDEAGAAILRELRRDYARNTKVPARLASELARITPLAQTAWEEARLAGNVSAFLPWLTQMIALRREEGQAIAGGGDPYDALMDDYEPQTSSDTVAATFDRMRPRLVALREAILGADTPPALTGHFAQEGQMRISRRLAEHFGYDFTRGRIDLAVHPFSSGSGDDVRITTRVAVEEPFNCLYSTIHEVGHAAYEQGVDAAYALTPIGRGVSMGVHESQSRIYENQLGRSRAFCGWLYGAMEQEFGALSVADADGFYAAANRVNTGYIRTEADEVQYNLHIMLRFDLERALIRGALEAGDLEEAWNTRFEADFGYPVDRPANGVLQDVHWSVGLFGYFPTYALGNIYAGCLYQTLRADLPDLDAQLSAGDTSAATGWLNARLQKFGALNGPRQTIANACGFDPDEGPLMDYLEAKFTELYKL